MTTPTPPNRPTYVFREGSHFGGDAQAVGEALEAVHSVNDEMPAEAVVDAARDPTSPLHSYFEWNDTVAAEQYRLHQARSLIRAVTVIEYDDGEQIAHAAYLNIKIAESGGTRQTYRSFNKVIVDPDQVRTAVRILQTNLEGVQRALREVERALVNTGNPRLEIIVGIEEAVTSARRLIEQL
jgi:hypothetical protein